jgi:flagellar motor switch protein FliN/FliY
MSSIQPELIDRLAGVQSQIWQTASLAVNEATNASISFSNPLTVNAKVSDLYKDLGAPMLVIQFALTSLPENSQVVLFPQETFAEFASVLKGEKLDEIDENLISEVRVGIEAVVQGMCMAIGNLRNEAVVASGLSLRFQIFSFPPNLQRCDELVRTQIAISGDELNGSITWLLDPETAAYVVGMQLADDEGSDTPFMQVAGGVQTAGTALGPTGSYDDAGIEFLLDIPLEISVELGRIRMLVKDVVELGTGSIVEIDKAAGEPVDVMVNGRLVARGEVVVIEDNFGVRITEILTPQERLARLGEVA